MQTFYGCHILLGSLNSPNALETRFSPHRHPLWTPAIHKPHGARWLLSLYNINWRFVPSVAVFAAPHYKPLKKQLVLFTPISNNDLDAIKTLKNALISPLILALPYSDKHMLFDLDAWHVQIDCVYYKNTRTIQPKQLGIVSVLSPTLTKEMTEPNAIFLRSYEPSFSYGHT